MSAWLTNLTYYSLVIIPPSTLLWLCDLSLASLWKVIALSLLLQLLTSIALEGIIISYTTTPTPLALVAAVVGHAILDPLVTLVFFAWALGATARRTNVHTSTNTRNNNKSSSATASLRPLRALGILEATAPAVALSEGKEDEATRLKEKEVQSVFFLLRLPQEAAWSLSRTVGQWPFCVCVALTAPWVLARLVLYYWSTWYNSMSTFGDVKSVWSGMFELFFYFMAAIAIARRLAVALPTPDGGEGVGGSSLIRSMLLRLLFIAVCTAGVTVAGSGLIVPELQAKTPVNVKLIVSILWSVS